MVPCKVMRALISRLIVQSVETGFYNVCCGLTEIKIKDQGHNYPRNRGDGDGAAHYNTLGDKAAQNTRNEKLSKRPTLQKVHLALSGCHQLAERYLFQMIILWR